MLLSNKKVFRANAVHAQMEFVGVNTGQWTLANERERTVAISLCAGYKLIWRTVRFSSVDRLNVFFFPFILTNIVRFYFITMQICYRYGYIIYK